jgi:hypothetical protein
MRGACRHTNSKDEPASIQTVKAVISDQPVAAHTAAVVLSQQANVGKYWPRQWVIGRRHIAGSKSKIDVQLKLDICTVA